MNCPRCQVELKDNIGYISGGRIFYRLYMDGEFLRYEFCEANDIDEFYCKNCMEVLDITEEDVKNILKGGENENL